MKDQIQSDQARPFIVRSNDQEPADPFGIPIPNFLQKSQIKLIRTLRDHFSLPLGLICLADRSSDAGGGLDIRWEGSATRVSDSVV